MEGKSDPTFLQLMRDLPLHDIVLCGYVCNSTVAHLSFTPMLSSVFLLFKKYEAVKYISIKAVTTHSQVLVGVHDEPSFDFDIAKDEEYATCGIGELFLYANYYVSHDVLEFEAYCDRHSQPADGLFSACSLMCSENNYLFFDPSDLHGITIGGELEKERWLRYQLEFDYALESICWKLKDSEECIRKTIDKIDLS